MPRKKKIDPMQDLTTPAAAFISADQDTETTDKSDRTGRNLGVLVRDKKTLDAARLYAEMKRTTLNGLVNDFLEQLVAENAEKIEKWRELREEWDKENA